MASRAPFHPPNAGDSVERLDRCRGGAATDAMRFLVRHLVAVPLAAIDPEDCCDWPQLRLVVRLTAAGERTIRAVRSGPGRRPRAAAVAIIGGKERTTREG